MLAMTSVIANLLACPSPRAGCQNRECLPLWLCLIRCFETSRLENADGNRIRRSQVAKPRIAAILRRLVAIVPAIFQSPMSQMLLRRGRSVGVGNLGRDSIMALTRRACLRGSITTVGCMLALYIYYVNIPAQHYERVIEKSMLDKWLCARELVLRLDKRAA